MYLGSLGSGANALSGSMSPARVGFVDGLGSIDSGLAIIVGSNETVTIRYRFSWVPFGFLAVSFLAGSLFLLDVVGAARRPVIAFGEDGPAVAQRVDDPFVGRDRDVTLVGKKPLPRQEEALVLKRRQRPSGLSLRSSWSSFLSPAGRGRMPTILRSRQRVGKRAKLVLDQFLARGMSSIVQGPVPSLRVIVELLAALQHQPSGVLGLPESCNCRKRCGGSCWFRP